VLVLILDVFSWCSLVKLGLWAFMRWKMGWRHLIWLMCKNSLNRILSTYCLLWILSTKAWSFLRCICNWRTITTFLSKLARFFRLNLILILTITHWFRCLATPYRISLIIRIGRLNFFNCSVTASMRLSLGFPMALISINKLWIVQICHCLMSIFWRVSL